tara:strand:- start:984 stop:2945 length:1962 start_codon:yes stop_codon:yes gene_type:complete
MRLLTKSRFKLGMECPNKLFYTRKKEYANQKQEDEFLEALAQGGFQVEELARLEYPEGVLIEGKDWDYEWLANRTEELLQRDNVVIFEAAFKHENLFIRTDILVKQGDKVQLIEVKAKSYDPLDEKLLVGVKGGIVKSWRPYLFDVAFQRYVIQQEHPTWSISSYLMMANKRKEAKVDGLNQSFRITNKVTNRTGIIKLIESIDEIGESVLGKVPIDTIVDDIQNGIHKVYENMDFLEMVQLFSDYDEKDQFFNQPLSFSACKGCEFRTTPEQEKEGLKSGFKECWKKQKGWGEPQFSQPSIFEVGNFRRGAKLFEEDKILMRELVQEDVGNKQEKGRMSLQQRQWIQIDKELSGDTTEEVWLDELKEEMDSWIYPLNFIDFETSAVALPFSKGRKPYEQVAFQFSHHTVDENGKIEHAGEWINVEAGKFPNFEFVRELKASLSKNNGTIFRYSNHENSILNTIALQLSESDEGDKEELIQFIKYITQSKKDATEVHEGERNMVDLWQVVKNWYYNPYTKGSNSIKAVLPAVLKSSPNIARKYAEPIGEIPLSSKNFNVNHVWFQFKDGELLSPYKILPPLFDGWSEEALDQTLSEMETIANGGAALTAYSKLQYEDMTDEERNELKSSLLKYCELDTLAMVMIYERFVELIQ